MREKVNVLMCCSALSVKGGMVSVVKNYLGYENWEKYNLIYVPTHTEKNKIIVAAYFAFAYLKILLLLLTKKIDIAHFHTAERGSFYRKAILVRTMKKFGVKTIMHHHAAEFNEFYNSLSEKRKRYVNQTLEIADVNIVLSQRLVTMLTDKSPNANVKVLYNAVKTYPQNPYNKDASNILFLGRLGKRKGVFDLLYAIKKINCVLPHDVKLYLCGDGEVEEVKKLITTLKLENRIKHIGWIEKDMKDQFFCNTAVNVLPSYNEGLPMSILETMAYGIPNISTNIASIPEVIVNDVNGYLIDPGDIDVLANAILKLYINGVRDRLSKEAYSLITNNFCLETHFQILKSIYDEIMGF